MNQENSVKLLRWHAKDGNVKGCKHVSHRNRRGLGEMQPLISTPLVAFDLLTTGSGEDIIEIGAVRYENGVEVAEFSTFVHPGRDVSPEELEGSGIIPSQLFSAPELAEVIPAFDVFLKNAVLAAHGDSYNVWMLGNAYEKVGDVLISPTIDTISWSWRLFDVLRRRYPYPDYLMNDFMAPVAEPYRAVESARLCGDEFLMALEEVSTEWHFA